MEFPDIQVIDHDCGPKVKKVTSQRINDHAFFFFVQHLQTFPPNIDIAGSKSGEGFTIRLEDESHAYCEIYVDADPLDFVVTHIKTEMKRSQFLIVRANPDRESIEWIAPKWKAVVMSETFYWNTEFLKKHDIKSIRSVYLYNANEVTHCCEAAGSYALYYCDVIVEFNNEVEDEVRYEVEDKVQVFCSQNEFVSYYHCSTIDAIEGEWHKDYEDDETDPDEVIGSYHGNPLW